MSASSSQAMIAEKVEGHTALGGRAVVFFGSDEITVCKGTVIDGRLLQGVVREENEIVFAEIDAITGAHLIEAPEERHE